MAIAILLRRCSRPTGIPDSIVSLSNTKKILFFRQTHKLLSFSSRSSAKCSSSVFFASHVPYSNNAVNDGEIYSDVEKDDAVAIYIHVRTVCCALGKISEVLLVITSSGSEAVIYCKLATCSSVGRGGG